jgi:hypothetical protein
MLDINRKLPYFREVVVLIVVVVLADFLDSDGSAVQISTGFWRIAALPTVLGVLLAAWPIQRYLLEKTRRSTYASSGRVKRLILSYCLALIVAGMIGYLTSASAAHLVNRFEGVPYRALYTVTDKYIHSGKFTCYGLGIVKPDDQGDRFNVCVGKSEQNSISLGERVVVRGVRSRYVNLLTSIDEQ